MAQTELTPRRLIPEDEVYRQVFDAEVSFVSFLAAQFKQADLGRVQ